MASPVQKPSARPLQLVTESTPSPSSTLIPPSPESFAQTKQQRRQSSISYTSAGANSNAMDITNFGSLSRRASIDYTKFSPPLAPKRRPRPLSIAIPRHTPASSISSVPSVPRPQTLTEIYAPFLSLIANKEAQVSELRGQLSAQEQELTILKRKWEKIVRNHLAFPSKQNDALTGIDGIDKVIREIQVAAATTADAVSEASSDNPSPIFSRFSMDSSHRSSSTDLSQSSPDSSIDIPVSTKSSYDPSPAQITTTVTASTSRRRSFVPAEKKTRSPSPSEPFPAPTSTLPSPSEKIKPKSSVSSRQRDNALAPLPGMGFSSAAFQSILPQMSNMNINVNFSDIKGGVDKFISPQQQKRASRVFEGLWEAVASPSAVAASTARKKEKKSDCGSINLLDTEDEDTIKPSNSPHFAVLSPDNNYKRPTKFVKEKETELDFSITASPSAFLSSSKRQSLRTPPIKEEEKESEDSGEETWNW